MPSSKALNISHSASTNKKEDEGDGDDSSEIIIGNNQPNISRLNSFMQRLTSPEINDPIAIRRLSSNGSVFQSLKLPATYTSVTEDRIRNSHPTSSAMGSLASTVRQASTPQLNRQSTRKMTNVLERQSSKYDNNSSPRRDSRVFEGQSSKADNTYSTMTARKRHFIEQMAAYQQAALIKMPLQPSFIDENDDDDDDDDRLGLAGKIFSSAQRVLSLDDDVSSRRRSIDTVSTHRSSRYKISNLNSKQNTDLQTSSENVRLDELSWNISSESNESKKMKVSPMSGSVQESRSVDRNSSWDPTDLEN